MKPLLKSRRTWLVAAALGAAVLLHGVAVVNLRLHHEENLLRVTAPHLHFLSGHPLEQLKNGASVLYSVQLALSSDEFATVERRSVERFVVSYDIWEERFSIVRIGTSKATVSHLDSAAAENWVTAKIALPTRGLSNEAKYWVRLDMRAEQPKDPTALLTQPPLAVARLVELFSQTRKYDPDRWTTDQGPFRFADLKP